MPQVLEKCERIAKRLDLTLTQNDFDVKLAGPGAPSDDDRRAATKWSMKPIPGRPMPHVFALHVEGDPPRFGSLTP